MKNLFKCEKCGRISDDYEEIRKCEEMHYIVPRPWYDVEGLGETLDSMTEYKDGQSEPSVIHVMLQRSYWDGDEWKDEKRCAKYKLVSSYEMPLVIENE